MIKQGSFGSFSPNLRDTKTVTLSCNPGNDIPVKGEIYNYEGTEGHYLLGTS